VSPPSREDWVGSGRGGGGKNDRRRKRKEREMPSLGDWRGGVEGRGRGKFVRLKKKLNYEGVRGRGKTEGRIM